MSRNFKITFIVLLSLLFSTPAVAGTFIFYHPFPFGYTSFMQTYELPSMPFKALQVFTDVTPQGYIIHVVAPGYNTGDLDIKVLNGFLMVTAKEQQLTSQQGQGFQAMQSWGMASHSVGLPENVDLSQMNIQVTTNGLRIFIPWRK